MTSATTAVVIPTFNRAGMLSRALDSVLAQSRAPNEILVIDDGSTDATSVLVHDAYPQVRYLRQARRGVSAARNRGIAATGAELIAFLDSDDEWRPHKLERQLAALAAQPDAALAHTDEIWVRNGIRVNPGARHRKAGGRIFRRCLPLCAISPSSALIRRRVLEVIGVFDESLPACEDYDLWLRICARFPVCYVDEPLVVKYGGHADQLSRQHWGLDRFRIRALARCLETDLPDAADRAAAARTLCDKISLFVRGAERRGRGAEVTTLRALRDRYEPLASAHRPPAAGADAAPCCT
jgi:glycosyltransferase involved in cell wall biosynthesis